MTIVKAGRMIFPSGSTAARGFAERNLLSVHGRVDRLMTMARGPRLHGKDENVENVEAVLHLPPELQRCVKEDWLLLGDYDGARRKRHVIFIFDRGRLSRILKVRPLDGTGAALSREAAVLRAIRARLAPPLLETVPEVLDHVTGEGEELLSLSPCAGQPLSIRMQRSLRPLRDHAAALTAAGRWLGQFHAATGDDGMTAVHGDFWTRNVLIERGLVSGVVDWEHGELKGDPARDLFMMPFLYALDAPRWWKSDPLTSYREVFHGRGERTRIVAAYFSSYAEGADCPLDDLGDRFDRWLQHNEDRRKEGGWESRYPWAAMLAITREADRSAFSG
jgi:hypothetical protein